MVTAIDREKFTEEYLATSDITFMSAVGVAIFCALFTTIALHRIKPE